jgi:hypothetical protein
MCSLVPNFSLALTFLQLVEYIDEFGRKRQVKRRDLPSVQALDSQPPPQTRTDRPQWQVSSPRFDSYWMQENLCSLRN